MTLPDDFIRLTEPVLGDRLWPLLVQGLAAEPPVSIRLNRGKCLRRGLDVKAADGSVAWCDDGYYLPERRNFTFDPLFHAGLYYVQEASSMFLHHVLCRFVGDAPVRMLDLCAAPGGKSAAARAVLPEGSLLVSNEPVRNRAQVLAENMRKQGHRDVIVTHNYPRDFVRSGLMFDVLLADVPCSGEGMFRKDPAAVGEWSVQNVEKCRRLQREIIADVWPCLRGGGLLVYSTCTFNTKENEENVRYICSELGAEVLDAAPADGWGIAGSLLPGFSEPVCRFIPGLTRGEGLFMAVMRKTGDDAPVRPAKEPKRARADKPKGKDGGGIRPDLSWLTCPDDFSAVRRGDVFTAVPKAWRREYDLAAASLNVLSAGVEFAEVKGRDVVPAHPLALSMDFNAAAFASVELDYAQAISYLRKEAVALPPDTPRGHVVMTYKGVPLGFEKNIGNRANNLYPAEWKIKSTHTPEGDNETLG